MDEEITFDFDDFGFTTASEEEISKPIAKESKANTEELQGRLDRLFNTIQPLLENLKKDPEKEFLKWPGRVEKVEQFQKLLENIYTGN